MLRRARCAAGTKANEVEILKDAMKELKECLLQQAKDIANRYKELSLATLKTGIGNDEGRGQAD